MTYLSSNPDVPNELRPISSTVPDGARARMRPSSGWCDLQAQRSLGSSLSSVDSFHRQAPKALPRGQRKHCYSGGVNKSRNRPICTDSCLDKHGCSLFVWKLHQHDGINIRFYLQESELHREKQPVGNSSILKPFLMHTLVTICGEGGKKHTGLSSFPQDNRNG